MHHTLQETHPREHTRAREGKKGGEETERKRKREEKERERERQRATVQCDLRQLLRLLCNNRTTSWAQKHMQKRLGSNHSDDGFLARS